MVVVMLPYWVVRERLVEGDQAAVYEGITRREERVPRLPEPTAIGVRYCFVSHC